MKRVFIIAMMLASSVGRAETPQFCFVGRAECPAIVLVESTNGVMRSTSPNGPGGFYRQYATVELGVLFSATARVGVGLSLGFTPFVGGQYSSHGFVRARARYWLSDVLATDLTIARFSAPMQGGTSVSASGFRIDGAIVFADHLGIVLGIDHTSFEGFEQSRNSPYVALRLGGAAFPSGLLGSFAVFEALD